MGIDTIEDMFHVREGSRLSKIVECGRIIGLSWKPGEGFKVEFPSPGL